VDPGRALAAGGWLDWLVPDMAGAGGRPGRRWRPTWPATPTGRPTAGWGRVRAVNLGNVSNPITTDLRAAYMLVEADRHGHRLHIADRPRWRPRDDRSGERAQASSGSAPVTSCTRNASPVRLSILDGRAGAGPRRRGAAVASPAEGSTSSPPPEHARTPAPSVGLRARCGRASFHAAPNRCAGSLGAASRPARLGSGSVCAVGVPDRHVSGGMGRRTQDLWPW
jgi:hypothetical protein